LLIGGLEHEQLGEVVIGEGRLGDLQLSLDNGREILVLELGAGVRRERQRHQDNRRKGKSIHRGEILSEGCSDASMMIGASGSSWSSPRRMRSSRGASTPRITLLPSMPRTVRQMSSRMITR